MRYYYKNGNNYYSFKTKHDDLTEITEQEFDNRNTTKELTSEQITSQSIAKLKQHLADTDYQAIKFAEGVITAEEYEPIKRQRQLWREQINELETR